MEMTSEECKLWYIYLKEDRISENMSLASLEVETPIYVLMLKTIQNKDLFVHFRDALILENYETAELARKELVKRGFTITIGDHSINFKWKK